MNGLSEADICNVCSFDCLSASASVVPPLLLYPSISCNFRGGVVGTAVIRFSLNMNFSGAASIPKSESGDVRASAGGRLNIGTNVSVPPLLQERYLDDVCKGGRLARELSK